MVTGALLQMTSTVPLLRTSFQEINTIFMDSSKEAAEKEDRQQNTSETYLFLRGKCIHCTL